MGFDPAGLDQERRGRAAIFSQAEHSIPWTGEVPAINAIAVAIVTLLLTLEGARAQQVVDLELVLAIDTSYSIDRGEFDLQTAGIARAFRQPGLHHAIQTAAPAGIAVTLVQWAGEDAQARVIDWTHVRSAAEAVAFGDRVARSRRHFAPGATAIGSAIEAGLVLLQGNRFVGRRRVIDVSGDGPNNSGTPPDLSRDRAVAAGITINGLPILNEVDYLHHYYRNHVIGGPGAFLVVAEDFESYSEAMLRKLIREVGGDQIADAGLLR